MKVLKPIVLVLIIVLFYSCSIFKKREVSISKKDSITTISSKVNTHEVTKNIDTSKTKNITIIHKTDSTESTTTIIPDSSENIIISSDGSFHGKAKKIITKTVKHINQDSTNTNTKDNHIINNTTKDSSNNTNTKTEVQTKDKHIISTPDYGWVKYAIIITVILGIVLYFYFRKKL